MQEYTFTVPFKEGLHARPAVKFIKLVGPMKSNITIWKGADSYAAKSIVSVLSAGITFGQQITIKAEGEDEEACIREIINFFENP